MTKEAKEILLSLARDRLDFYKRSIACNSAEKPQFEEKFSKLAEALKELEAL